LKLTGESGVGEAMAIVAEVMLGRTGLGVVQVDGEVD
jgi:hypothetical protein